MAAEKGLEQLKALATGLSLVQQISIVAAALAVAGGIAALTHFRNESDFRPLYTAMAPEDAAPVVQKLKESAVEYRLTDGGSTVLVPSAKLAESRLTLAGAGLPKSGRAGFELFDKANFGATELVEHINYQRALEGELERSVMSMAEVVQARVHLSLPKESVFLDQQLPAKASVMVKLRPGGKISVQNVMAVTNLVASAVEGLNADAVAVLDMDGNLLSRPRRTSNAESAVTSEALEVRQQIERDLVAKMGSTLEPLLGSNNFRAGASVDCDLTSGEQQEETFDPDKSVMVTSQKTEDESQRNIAGGIPGVAANLPHPPEKNGGNGGTSRRTENVTYQTSRVVKHMHIPQGVVRRMSLSVLVGQEIRWEGQGKARHRVTLPPSAETLKTIRELVAGVTGFNMERGDQLIVESLPFESALDADAMRQTPIPAGKPTGPAWLDAMTKYRDVLLLALAAIVVLTVFVNAGLRRRTTRTSVEAMVEPALAAGTAMPLVDLAAAAPDRADISAGAQQESLLIESHDAIAERVRDLAQRDLAATANVLRMWLQEQKTV